MFDYYLIVFSDYCPALREKDQLYYNADILGLTIDKSLEADGYVCCDFSPDEPVETRREKLDAAEHFLGYLSVQFGFEINRENLTFRFSRKALNERIDQNIAEFREENGKDYLVEHDNCRNTADFFLMKEFSACYDGLPVVYNGCGTAYYWTNILDCILYACREGGTYRITQVLGLDEC